MKKIKNLTKTQIIIGILLLAGLGGSITGATYLVNNESKQKDAAKEKVLVYESSLALEVYSEAPNIESYTKENTATLEFKDLVTEDVACPVDDTADTCEIKKLVSKVGTYEGTIKYDNKSYKVTLEVVDKTVPVLKLKEVTITEGESYDINSFIESKEDNSKTEVTVNFETEEMKTYTAVGEYTIKVKAEDESKNSLVAETKLVIKKKEVIATAPSTNYTNTSPNSPSTGNTGGGEGTGQVKNCTYDGWVTGYLSKVYEVGESGFFDPVFQARLAIENDRYADSEVNRAKTKWQADYGINWSGENIFVISNSCGQDFAYKMEFTIEMAGANPRLSEYISKAAGYGDKYILGEYYINTSGNMVWDWNPNNLPVR